MRLGTPTVLFAGDPLYRDRIRRVSSVYRLRAGLKRRKGTPVFTPIRFETHCIRLSAAVDLRLAMPVDTVIPNRHAGHSLRVGTGNGVPRDQFGDRSSSHDSDTHPYASVGRL